MHSCPFRIHNIYSLLSVMEISPQFSRETMMMAQPPRHPLLLPPFLLLLLLLHRYCPAQADPISALDLAALREIRDDLTDIPGTDFFSTWDFTSPDPCSDFAGVTCSGDPPRVTILTLGTGLSASPGLAGSLSPSLSKLTQLTQLVLFPGIVTGPIPPELGRLTQLRVLSLTNNRLTGPIPTSISALRSLHTLDLSSNQLTGPLLPSLSGLSQLKVLVLASNRLSGELPKSLPAQLLHLDLKNNGFWGRLPLRLPAPLRYLSASGNQMWGPLNGLESLSSELVYLDLSMNRFSGPIPASLFRSTLSSMLLQRNNLSGGLPRSSSSSPSYGPGSIVDLSHNSLGGEISTVLAGAESVFLNNNRLTGRVPVEYIDAVRQGSTRTLYLQHNYLTGFPVEGGLPDSASVCLAYNCMVPPVGLATCPASAGGQLSRPMNQCPVFNHNDSSTG